MHTYAYMFVFFQLMCLQTPLLLEPRTGSGGIVERMASVCHYMINIQSQAKSQVCELLLFPADVARLSRGRSVGGAPRNC